MYLVIEGVDTAGKSTQIELLKQAYPDAIFTKEPGGSILGERLRKILLEEKLELSKEAEFLLFLSDRAEHFNKVISPNLSRLIISDRSLISGIAYAKEIEQALMLNLFAMQNRLPDRVILLELKEDELLLRLGGKKQDRIERRGVSYLLEIQKRMIEASHQLNIPLIRIDASLAREEIHQRIVQEIK